MKEVVLTKPPYMNASEQRIADMHSVFNILNILICELSLLEPEDSELQERVVSLDSEFNSITRELKEGGNLPDLLTRLQRSEEAALALMKAALNDVSTGERRAELQESLGNFESVFSVLKERLEELQMRSDDPDLWVQIETATFRKQFEDVFDAIAKNSKGDYGIQFNLAQKEKGDYYMDLKFDTHPDGEWFWMPLRLIDVLRDLTANARKYTKPGGKVALAVYQDEKNIHAVVEDSGCGIPEDELEKVTEFGYRATNVRHRPTLGGGFGLTKAAWLVTNWGGSLTLQSELDEGTNIRISIPNVEMPESPTAWTI